MIFLNELKSDMARGGRGNEFAAPCLCTRRGGRLSHHRGSRFTGAEELQRGSNPISQKFRASLHRLIRNQFPPSSRNPNFAGLHPETV
jgi:hypothetical protein